MFDSLAHSKDGQILNGFIQRLIVDSVDSRNITGNVEVEVKARSIVAKLLQDNFIERFKVLRGEAPIEIPEYE